MKWIVIAYLLIIIVGFSLWYYLKKKRNIGSMKVYFPVFCIVNACFLCCFCFVYYKDYQNSYPLVEKNRTLMNAKKEKEEAINQVKQEVETLENTIMTLDNSINELKENKSTLTSEIKKLKQEYNTLYVKMQNTALYQVENFPTFDQRKDYPNGCESIALYLLLKYHGVHVTPDEIINKLRKGASPYISNGVKYGADPEIEFVGDPKSKSGYGVFENPIIDVANQFKSGIIKATGKSLDEVLEIVKSGKPVQVWASSYQRTPTKCNTWTSTSDNSKKTITWYCHFHSLVLIGATSSKVIVSDPLTGTIVNYDKAKFEYAYNFYGRRAIYYE